MHLFGALEGLLFQSKTLLIKVGKSNAAGAKGSLGPCGVYFDDLSHQSLGNATTPGPGGTELGRQRAFAHAGGISHHIADGQTASDPGRSLVPGVEEDGFFVDIHRKHACFDIGM